jgi:hypothetical protein
LFRLARESAGEEELLALDRVRDTEEKLGKLTCISRYHFTNQSMDSIASISSRKTLRKRTSSCPVQHIEQSKCIKLTIDTNIQWAL